MTLDEIEQSLTHAIAHPEGDRTHVHINFIPQYLDIAAPLVLEAIQQIKRTVTLCAAKIVDPKEHRAEALLLMILDQAYYHGYNDAALKKLLDGSPESHPKGQHHAS